MSTSPNSSADSYELARDIVNGASQQPFATPVYTGGTTDFAYLKNWILGQVVTIYGIDATIFDTSTVLSTSILRDFVHRAIQETPAPYHSAIDSPGFITWNDVGYEFRTEAKGLCGEIATQEWLVFRAFGFQTNQINSIDGTPDQWRNSHATTEVYVSDLGKYIIQDATFNFVYRDDTGQLLSWSEAREANMAGELVFDNFKNFSSYNSTGTYEDPLRPSIVSVFERYYLKTVSSWLDSTGTRTALITKMFPNPTGAHSVEAWQGGQFATESDARAAVVDLTTQGFGWTESASELRAQGYYVSGFAFADRLGNRTDEWITLRVANGDYVSISRTGTDLHGSYDQLQLEATGGHFLNPGVDLSGFLAATYLLAADGSIMNPGVAMPTATDIFGTSAAETLVGTAAIDRIFGYGGDDIIDGGGGADYLSGGIGNDTYYVSSAAAHVIEQPGEGRDAIYARVDVVVPENVEVLHLIGPALKATLKSGEGWLSGNAANNTLDARGAVGHLSGGTGNDAYFVDNAATTILENPGEGRDTVYAYADYTLPANVEVLNLKGAAVRATMSLGEVWSSGNANDNVFDSRGALGHLNGLTGNDTYILDNPATSISENANEGTDTVDAYSDYRLPANVEIVNLKGAAIRATLTSGEAWAYGNENNNVLDARAALGHLYGGAGDDAYYVTTTASAVVEQPGEGADTVHANVTYSLPANVENLILDGNANVNGTGNALPNTLIGNGGRNVLNGAAGADIMRGGLGNDTYFIDHPGDAVVEIAGQGSDTVYAYCDYVVPANVEVLNLKGAAIRGTLSAGEAWLYGNSNDNVLDARGALGHLYGGPGSDTYYVDNASTGVIEDANEGNDTVRSLVSYTLSANVENLNLDGTANVNGTGNALGNALRGNSGRNALEGKGGADVLTGGAGADRFVFGAPDGSSDHVTDFSAAEGDKLALRASDFGLSAGKGVLQTSALDPAYFEVNDTATLSHAELFFNATNKVLFWDADGVGTSSAAMPIMTFTLPLGTDPATFLHNTDFIVLNAAGI